MLISRFQSAPSLLYTLSCKHESWISTAKYLTEDVPVLLKREDVKDVEKVLSIVLTSLPTNFSEFIKWVAEVRRQDDGALSKEEKERVYKKEEVLRQVRETALFKHVKDWMSSPNSCCTSISSLDAKETLPDIAARVCCQGAELLTGKPGPSNGFCCRATGVKCLKSNGDKPVTMVSGTVMNGTREHGVDMLVPFSQIKSSCHGSDLSCCTGMHPASTDILTALLLALPAKTWSGIRDGNLLQKIRNLVEIEDLPSLLQEEVLHLRRQLHFLKRCQDKKVDDDIGEPLNLQEQSLSCSC